MGTLGCTYIVVGDIGNRGELIAGLAADGIDALCNVIRERIIGGQERKMLPSKPSLLMVVLATAVTFSGLAISMAQIHTNI